MTDALKRVGSLSNPPQATTEVAVIVTCPHCQGTNVDGGLLATIRRTGDTYHCTLCGHNSTVLPPVDWAIEKRLQRIESLLRTLLPMEDI